MSKAMEPIKYRLSITPERALDAELRYIPLDELKLDPKNVRFKHFQRSLSDEEMEDEIWSDPDTRNLYREILYSNGLQNPPLVNSNNVVQEGNRRVVCLGKLKEDIQSGKVDIPLKKIDPVQCVVFPDYATDIDVAIYLTREHVTGKKEWAALDKASHIYDLYNLNRLSFDQIREAVSMSKATAMKMEAAYKKTLEYHTKYPDDKGWLGRYSYFYELYKKKQLKNWRENEDNMELFMDWIHNGKIERGEQVRELPRIINEPDAYQTLADGDIGDAIDVLSKKDPAVGSVTFNLLSKALKVIQDFPRSELLDSVKNKPKLQFLERLHSELEDLIRDVKSASK